MATTPPNDAALNALHEEIAALKRDLASLLAHIKPDTESSTKAAKAALGQFEQQVEQQPLLAVLIALCVGYIGGRLLSR